MPEDEILEIDLSSSQDEEDDFTPNYVAPAPEYVAQSRIHSDKLAQLEAKQAQLDEERIQQENQRVLYAMEQRFPNVGEEERAYIKSFIRLNNEILEKQLAARDAKLEALSKKIYENELNTDHLKSFINNVDYRTTMHEICNIALREKFKGKLVNGVTSDDIDFALSEYELRLQNDEKFALKIKSITSDNKLKPAKIKSLLAKEVSDNFVKAYVEKYKKSGKRSVEVQVADEPKKTEPKKTAPAAPAASADSDAPPMTPQQYKAMTDRLLRSI
jgi:hypothetical protein